ncbi:hypothetical protein [Teichococcus wenyumeiae]|uniref:hypothetical protein n=1 Tax=Teichococcus wenyumeiae TaxID=2478470 RepID=UPI0011C3940C|nr:hypothetical protein [Pseudoroseomonas wenyumeiae]
MKMQLRILMSSLSLMATGLAFGTPAAQAAQAPVGISRQGPSDLEYVQQRQHRGSRQQSSNNSNLPYVPNNPNNPAWDNDETARLNAESLRRAQMGENSPTNQPDTTSNLNRMSEQDAERGVNVGNQPLLPFR